MIDNSPIRVLIVDDHRLVRDGLHLLLSTFADFEIAGMAENGEEAVLISRQNRPDVILMDCVMPQLDGPDATARILAENPDISVIALTSFVEEDLVTRAINAGAVGYLLKNVSPEQLADAIRAAYQGRPTIDAEAAQVVLRAQRQVPRAGLTPREREVLQLIVLGDSNKEIALTLNLSPSTVRGYVSDILNKLEVRNRTEAAIVAVERGLVTP